MLYYFNECENCGKFERSEEITLDYEPDLAIWDKCPECGSSEIETGEYDDGYCPDNYDYPDNFSDYDYLDYGGPDY